MQKSEDIFPLCSCYWQTDRRKKWHPEAANRRSEWEPLSPAWGLLRIMKGDGGGREEKEGVHFYHRHPCWLFVRHCEIIRLHEVELDPPSSTSSPCIPVIHNSSVWAILGCFPAHSFTHTHKTKKQLYVLWFFLSQYQSGWRFCKVKLIFNMPQEFKYVFLPGWVGFNLRRF